uniref:Uncharacterized protein n=1 Tax=Arundo donax TaxID=35708 RepID=A0A0A9I008_ARUDO
MQILLCYELIIQFFYHLIHSHSEKYCRFFSATTLSSYLYTA